MAACMRPDRSRASVVLLPPARGHRKTRETRHYAVPGPSLESAHASKLRSDYLLPPIAKVVAAMVKGIDNTES